MVPQLLPQHDMLLAVNSLATSTCREVVPPVLVLDFRQSAAVVGNLMVLRHSSSYDRVESDPEAMFY